MENLKNVVEFNINGIEITVHDFEGIVNRCIQEEGVNPYKIEAQKDRISKQLQNEIEYDIEKHAEKIEFGETEELDGEIAVAFDNDIYGGNNDYRCITLTYTFETDWKGRYRKAVVTFPG